MILIILIIIIILILLIYEISKTSSYKPQNILSEVDIIIVGAGTAGCVVARRLSERFPNKRICVLERGGNYTNNPVVYNPKNATTAAYSKPFSQVLTTNFPNVNISLASMFGGGSSHNFSLAVFGSPNFYNTEWGPILNTTYVQLQPIFTKINTMITISPLPQSIDLKTSILPVLSKGFPTTIKSFNIFSNMGPLRANDAFSDSITSSIAKTKGVPISESYNGNIVNCTSKIPEVFIDFVTGIRQETFSKYLPNDYLTKAKNLVIVPNANVLSITSKSVRWLDSNGEENQTYTKKIILAAGAVYTPFILLKSGFNGNGRIGKDLINSYGCQCICSVDSTSNSFPEFSSGPVSFVPYFPESQTRDWQVVVTGSVDKRLLEGQPPTNEFSKLTFSFLLWRLNCRSRGEVREVQENSNIPQVDLNMFTDGDLTDPNSDISSILAGLRWLYEVITMVRKDYPSISVLYPPESKLIENNSEVLVEYIKNSVSVTDHYCHTVPLGTVVDPKNFRLMGFPTSKAEQGNPASKAEPGTPSISVVDASVFPQISDGNTTYPVLVMAEIAAERIIKDLI